MKKTVLAIITIASLFTTACSEPVSEQEKTMIIRWFVARSINLNSAHLVRSAYRERIITNKFTKASLVLIEDKFQQALVACLKSPQYDLCLKITGDTAIHHNKLKELIEPHFDQRFYKRSRKDLTF